MSERSLVLVKPDGVSRGLVGEVISRIERKGLRLVALELRNVERSVAEQHYAEHASKPFFGSLLEFITGGPLVAMVVEGERAIDAFRQLAGATDPVKSATGSIRGDFAVEVQYNIVHGSDSPESAKREIDLWFPGV
ncbi:nucleoside-diphosphate kinase [Actinophytocola xinjiangensis]|uniref:Nucleoside diphosphate kinase n=1 Tax=Actinophytocola xinjiangensis TaxID=485602 RepID=A0A7Z0WL87_9PSEU|nr:nucleoside-diphosphate kinase [Actinophytocola xinjiangensis]OLF08813.1 nucleoside-diphosphate kinase [Actinophytocola xinjiangensis]